MTKDITIKDFAVAPVDVAGRQKLDIRSGDVIKVWQKIKEKDKFRLQAFEGLVLATKHGKEAGGTFTVRKVVDGVGVERIFPIYSPLIDKVEIIKRSKVRQAKLYHIRRKAAKEIKKEMSSIRKIKEQNDEVISENKDTKAEETHTPKEAQE
jgi:large subunit ribosomal protein L19